MISSGSKTNKSFNNLIISTLTSEILAPSNNQLYNSRLWVAKWLKNKSKNC